MLRHFPIDEVLLYDLVIYRVANNDASVLISELGELSEHGEFSPPLGNKLHQKSYNHSSSNSIFVPLFVRHPVYPNTKV